MIRKWFRPFLLTFAILSISAGLILGFGVGHMRRQLYSSLVQIPKVRTQFEQLTLLLATAPEADPKRTAQLWRKYSDNPWLANRTRAYALEMELEVEGSELEDIGTAEETFKRWVQFVPESPAPYVSMGRIYVKGKKKPEEAIAVLSRALELDERNQRSSGSSSVDVRYLRGRAFLLAGKNVEALEDLKAARPASPKIAGNSDNSAVAQELLRPNQQSRAEHLYYLGEAYEANRLFADAVSVYLEGISVPSEIAHEFQLALERAFVAAKLGTKQQLVEKIVAAKDVRRKAVVALYKPVPCNVPAAEFEFTTIKGQQFKSEQLRGRVTVLNFWGVG